MQRHLLWKLKQMMIVVVGAVALAPAASALPIAGLFDTGVDNSGNALALGSAEQHYAVSGPSSSVTVMQRPLWVTPPTGSAWVGPGSQAPGGVWTYSLSFDLTGLEASTAVLDGRFSADDSAEIFLNGTSTGISIAGTYASLTAFVIDDGFLDGVNVLQFRVTNNSGQLNPSGLLVADLTGSANVAHMPEPSTALLLGLGLAGVASMGRRR